MTSGLTIGTSMSDFFLFFGFGWDLAFFPAPSSLLDDGRGFSSGTGGGGGGGGEQEGMEESGEMEVMSTEGERSLCKETCEVAGDGMSSTGGVSCGGGSSK
jgi:hypothetical protein